MASMSDALTSSTPYNQGPAEALNFGAASASTKTWLLIVAIPICHQRMWKLLSKLVALPLVSLTRLPAPSYWISSSWERMIYDVPSLLLLTWCDKRYRHSGACLLIESFFWQASTHFVWTQSSKLWCLSSQWGKRLEFLLPVPHPVAQQASTARNAISTNVAIMVWLLDFISIWEKKRFLR